MSDPVYWPDLFDWNSRSPVTEVYNRTVKARILVSNRIWGILWGLYLLEVVDAGYFFSFNGPCVWKDREGMSNCRGHRATLRISDGQFSCWTLDRRWLFDGCNRWTESNHRRAPFFPPAFSFSFCDHFGASRIGFKSEVERESQEGMSIEDYLKAELVQDLKTNRAYWELKSDLVTGFI